MVKEISIRKLSMILRQSGVGSKVISKVLGGMQGFVLPVISKGHIKQLKVDLVVHHLAALSLSESGKVRMVNPTRLRLKDGRVKTLRRLAEERRGKSKKEVGEPK